MSSQEKRELLAELLRRRAAEPRDYPLSFNQEGLWFLDQLRPGSAAYNIPVVVRFAGLLDVGLLGRCVGEVVRRHEVLRSVFEVVGGRPVRRVLESVEVPVSVVDVRGGSREEVLARARGCVVEAAEGVFDLRLGPLLRVRVVRLGQAEFWVVFLLHHIVADGWSVGVLLGELAELYRGGGVGSSLAGLGVGYSDWVRWQREWLSGERLAGLLSWWRERLAGVPVVLELPGDRPRPPVQSLRGAQCDFEIPAPLHTGLAQLAQREGATLYMVLLAGFAVLLHRYTGQADLVIGTPVANRGRPEFEKLIGFFVNTVPLRVDLASRPTFRRLLGRVRESTLEAFARQEVPFANLVQELRPERSLAYNPLVQVMFTLQPPDTTQHHPHAVFRLVPGAAGHSGTAKFDLTLYLSPNGDALRGTWEYNTDLFDADRVERMSGHLCTLLQAAVDDADVVVDRLPLLDAEQRALLAAAPAPLAAAPPATLVDLFAASVARHPERLAASDGERAMTYAQLDAAANQLAHHLRGLGVGPEVLVGVCLERGVDYVLALLAVLKAGGGYVPLDPAYPPHRLRFTLSDSGCAAVVGQRRFADRVAGTGLPFVAIDAGTVPAGEPASAPRTGVRPDNVAYVIYTSGSTGQPKGVAVSHANVTRLFAVTRDEYAFGPDDIWTLFHSFAFDFSVWELWGALLHGGQVVVVPFRASRDPDAFLRLLVDRRVTMLSQTPSAFRHLAAAAERAGWPSMSLRLVVFGGEALEPALLRAWMDRYGDTTPALVNMYGITETTVHVTHRRMSYVDTLATDCVIGRPLPDLRAYVLDGQLAHTAPGIVGELYIGGAGVSRGYLNLPDRTATRFLPDPYGRPGERLYRSGDLAIRRADGELIFCGRADNQVQLRGFRIELNEIDHALLEEPGVRQAATLVREDATGEQRLVSYVVPAPGASPRPDQLRAGLSSRLPGHLVPSAFVLLDSLPMTGNGKLDRAALPTPDARHVHTSTDRTAPRGPREQELAAIWSDILGIAGIGVHDNFFELGGHSLLATEMVARVRDTFGVDVPVRLAFELPTLEALADAIAQGQAGRDAGGGRSVGGRAGNPWLLGHDPSDRVRVRLLCFPYSGGGASLFQGWSAGLPPEVDVCAVQLPGRQNRLSEAPFVELEPLVAAIDVALRPLADLPWALFGHSFGGIVAFELARLLHRQGREPAHLFVASLRAPRQVAARRAAPGTDAELVAMLREREARVGEATPEHVSDLLLPALRADLTILDRYEYRDGPPLRVPLSVFGGADDQHPAPRELTEWGAYTAGPCTTRVLPGGHFFLAEQRGLLHEAIRADLGKLGLVPL